MAESHGFAHSGEKKIPSELEAGSQLDKLLFASARLLCICEGKNVGFNDKIKRKSPFQMHTFATQTLLSNVVSRGR